MQSCKQEESDQSVAYSREYFNIISRETQGTSIYLSSWIPSILMSDCLEKISRCVKIMLLYYSFTVPVDTPEMSGTSVVVQHEEALLL